MIFQKANPIIIREMRGRMRGWRAFVVLTGYLILLSCLAGSVYAISYQTGSTSYGLNTPTLQYGVVMGKAIFSSTVILLLVVISFIAPAFTADAIAGERERQTYEILLVTPMRARQIVGGKLGAVFLFLLLLILASLPIQSLAFLFGGVELIEVFIAALGLLVTALAFGALGLYISSRSGTTMIAIVKTYGLVILFIYALPIVLFYIIIPFDLFNSSSSLLLMIVLVYLVGFFLSINPFSAAFTTAAIAVDGQGYFLARLPIQTGIWIVSPWLVYVTFYSLLTVWLVWSTVRRVGQMSDK